MPDKKVAGEAAILHLASSGCDERGLVTGSGETRLQGRGRRAITYRAGSHPMQFLASRADL